MSKRKKTIDLWEKRYPELNAMPPDVTVDFDDLYSEEAFNDFGRVLAEGDGDWEGVRQCDEWEREHASVLQSSAYCSFVRQQEAKRSPEDEAIMDAILKSLAERLESNANG